MTHIGEHAVRHARAADLRHIGAIEDSGDALFVEYFGEPIGGASATGAERVDVPGFLLVTGQPPVGFAHVVVLDGYAHLEQVSVRASALRQGIGTSLVRAAMGEACAEGYLALSLSTYRDVPWNGPFYRSLGFVEVDDPLQFQRRLREHEQMLGLDRHGVRVVMSVALTRRVAGA